MGRARRIRPERRCSVWRRFVSYDGRANHGGERRFPDVTGRPLRNADQGVDMPISRERCRRCGFDEQPLDADQIAGLMPYVPGWEVVANDLGQRLTRSFPFEDWRTAMDFASRIGEQATFEDHHPILTITWGRVTVEWWTHVIGGLHRNDFIMACRTDHLFKDSPLAARD